MNFWDSFEFFRKFMLKCLIILLKCLNFMLLMIDIGCIDERFVSKISVEMCL